MKSKSYLFTYCIFDEDYPGFVDGFYVNFCPMCGTRLKSGYANYREEEHNNG